MERKDGGISNLNEDNELLGVLVLGKLAEEWEKIDSTLAAFIFSLSFGVVSLD